MARRQFCFSPCQSPLIKEISPGCRPLQRRSSPSWPQVVPLTIGCTNPWPTEPEIVSSALPNAQFTFLQSLLPQHSFEQRDQIAPRGQLAGQSGCVDAQLPLGTCCRLSLSMQRRGQMKCVQGAARVISNRIQFPLLRKSCLWFPETLGMMPFRPFNTPQILAGKLMARLGEGSVPWVETRMKKISPWEQKGLKWQGETGFWWALSVE